MARRPARGVSLIEALVALAVMAFGMLAIVGLQSALRLNSDVAKQRSEAVRIAQEAIEQWRAFTTIDAVGGQLAYADIAAPADQLVVGYTTNTSYTLTRNVGVEFDGGLKSVQVIVAWTDRNGEAQRVELDAIIARADPAVSGTLSLPSAGAPSLPPRGRAPGIPPAAVDVGGGKSAFRPAPEGQPDVVWLFDNLSGVITSVCTFPGTDLQQLVPATECLEQPSYLITGVVRFDFSASPNPEAPADLQVPIGMLALAVGGAYADGDCRADPVRIPALRYTTYYCRVRHGADATWTGTTVLGPPLDLQSFDVCRYTNAASGNAAHPQVYVHLDRSLTHQNFLVVGEGIACPAGTQPHQPPP